MKELKPTSSHANHCIYTSAGDGSKTIVAFYVDKILILFATKNSKY